MRLFVAVEIDPALARRAAEAGDRLRRLVATAAPRATVTWVPDDRLHLTVRFIGEVDEATAAAIREALTPPLETAPFEIVLAGAGAFPPRGAPRAFFVAIAKGGDELAAVERDVSARLAGCGVPAENRPYRPHLTLARVREAAGLRSSAVLERADAAAIGSMRVEAITLFESRLSPKGPTYVAMQRTPAGRRT